MQLEKGEEDYLDEWINYHLQLGFDKIYLYDNNPKGNTKQKDICDKYPPEKEEILKKYIENSK